MTYWKPEGFYQLGEEEYAHSTAANVLARMLEITGLASLSALAERLGVRLPLLTDARRRNIMPVRWLQNLPHSGWILKGKGKGPCGDSHALPGHTYWSGRQLALFMRHSAHESAVAKLTQTA